MRTTKLFLVYFLLLLAVAVVIALCIFCFNDLQDKQTRMEHRCFDDLAWIGAIIYALMLLAPLLLIEHLRDVRRVKREAGVRKLSKKHITVTGDIVRIDKKAKA